MLGFDQTPRLAYQFPKPNLKLPWPYLPSLLATATVLSFYDFKNEVFIMMRQLSKTTYNYLEQNKLRGFLIEGTGLTRNPTYLLNFDRGVNGRQVLCYPSPSQLRSMQRMETNEKPVRLIAVRYSFSGNELNALQLRFSNGVKSPVLTSAIRAPYIDDECLKEIRLYRTVRAIHIDYVNTSIFAILFYGEDRNRPFTRLQAFNTVLHENKTNFRIVPYGHEIVGVRCNYSTTCDGGGIRDISFELWAPPIENNNRLEQSQRLEDENKMQVYNDQANEEINMWKECYSRIIFTVIPCLTFGQAITTCIYSNKSWPFWLLAGLIQSIVTLHLTKACRKQIWYKTYCMIYFIGILYVLSIVLTLISTWLNCDWNNADKKCSGINKLGEIVCAIEFFLAGIGFWPMFQVVVHSLPYERLSSTS